MFIFRSGGAYIDFAASVDPIPDVSSPGFGRCGAARHGKFGLDEVERDWGPVRSIVFNSASCDALDDGDLLYTSIGIVPLPSAPAL
jgi:hypothetical protein